MLVPTYQAGNQPIASRPAGAFGVAEGQRLGRRGCGLPRTQARLHCPSRTLDRASCRWDLNQSLNYPPNKRPICDKPKLVQECLVVRHCGATSHTAIAFVLEESARGPYSSTNRADIKERIGPAYCLQFRRPSPFPIGLVRIRGRERNTPRPSWPIAYDERPLKHENGGPRAGLVLGHLPQRSAHQQEHRPAQLSSLFQTGGGMHRMPYGIGRDSQGILCMPGSRNKLQRTLL